MTNGRPSAVVGGLAFTDPCRCQRLHPRTPSTTALAFRCVGEFLSGLVLKSSANHCSASTGSMTGLRATFTAHSARRVPYGVRRSRSRPAFQGREGRDVPQVHDPASRCIRRHSFASPSRCAETGQPHDERGYDQHNQIEDIPDHPKTANLKKSPD
jgi:hypothetical protein